MFAKNILLLCNLLFVVSAIFKIALSSTLLTLQHKVDARLSSHCIFTLINGCVLLLLSIFGYCGISKRRIWMLKMFLFASLIITIIHTMLAVIAFATVYKMDGSKTKIAIARIFARYDIDQRHKKQVDDIQIELMCCGVEGPHSWKTKIPDSCCHIVRNNVCDEQSAYKTSCSDVLVASYKKYKWILAIEATTTATGACVVAVITFFIIRHIMRNRESDVDHLHSRRSAEE